MPSSDILRGIRVVNLTTAVAGPFAGRLLRSLGADVVKIESLPRGDVILERPPRQRGSSVGYTLFNRGKRIMPLDLHTARDLATARELIAGADAFITNLRVGAPERLGLGFTDVQALNDRLVYGRMTGWGTEGPLADWPGADPLVQFFSGWASIQGVQGARPELGRFVALIGETTGALLAVGVVQALLAQLRGKPVRYVGVSLLRAALMMQLTRLAGYWAGGAAEPLGSRSALNAPEQAFQCADGEFLAVGVETDVQWRALCAALDQPELGTDPRFRAASGRLRHAADLEKTLTPVFASFPSNWWRVVLDRHRVPNGRFNDWENLRYHAHVLGNGIVDLAEIPEQGAMYVPGVPWSITTRDPLPFRLTAGAPAAGESGGGGGSAHSSGPQAGPLDGLLVADTTQGIYGPFVTRLLADAGASVLKVEGPEPDYARQLGHQGPGGVSAQFDALNWGKRLITIDPATAGGRDAFSDLVRQADTVVADAAAGGFPTDPAALWSINPSLVVGQLSAYGPDGPLAGKPGSELSLQAVSSHWEGLGVRSDHATEPVRVGADIASAVPAVFAALAISAGLFHRARTGSGAEVLCDRFAALVQAKQTAWAAQTDPDEWDGWAARLFYPPDYGYRTNRGPVYLLVMRADDGGRFHALLEKIGLGEKRADPRFGSGGKDAVGIGQYAPELKSAFEAAFARFDRDELITLFQEAGILMVALNTYAEAGADPRLASSQLWADDPAGTRRLRPPWEFTLPDLYLPRDK